MLGRGGGILPITGYTGRLRPKGVPFLCCSIQKGRGAILVKMSILMGKGSNLKAEPPRIRLYGVPSGGHVDQVHYIICLKDPLPYFNGGGTQGANCVSGIKSCTVLRDLYFTHIRTHVYTSVS